MDKRIAITENGNVYDMRGPEAAFNDLVASGNKGVTHCSTFWVIDTDEQPIYVYNAVNNAWKEV